MEAKGEIDCRQQASELFGQYVTFLDERRFEEWLGLFTEDAFYSMLLHKDYVEDTNMLAIGEDKSRLAGRIEVGQNVERDQPRHLLTAVMAEKNGAAVLASSNFAVIRHGLIHCSGRYRMELVRRGDEIKIRRCVVVLDNEVIHGTLYLPV